MKLKKQTVLLYIAILLICLTFSCLTTNYDFDFFARIIVGERFVEQGILPFKDFLSYTPTHPWYDHEWGSGVVFYLILKYFGAFGTILLQTILMFGTAFFIIKTQRVQKHAFPTSLLFMSTFMVLFYNINAAGIRCHLFSFLFFSLFLYLMETLRKNYSTKLIWSIPIITIIWNNLHGGVVSGLGLIFMYMVGEFLSHRPWKKHFALLAISTPLLIINPYGIKYLNFLFSATTMNRKYIVEWWHFLARRHVVAYLPVSLFSIFGFLSSFLSKKKFDIAKIDITKTIVLAVTLYSGLAHVKLLSISLIAVCALCYNDIMLVLEKVKNRLKLKFAHLNLFNLFRKIEKALYPAVIALALFVIPLSSPAYPRCDAKKYPIYETEFLRINNLKGNVVVPFGYGSYFSYKLYPNNLIYMDGRYEEVYNNREFLTLRDYELGEYNWRDIVNNYPTDILMPRKNIEVYGVLLHDDNWVQIFNGNVCAIFVKKGKEKSSYLEPEHNIDYYKRTMFDSVTFGKKLTKLKAGDND